MKKQTPILSLILLAMMQPVWANNSNSVQINTDPDNAQVISDGTPDQQAEKLRQEADAKQQQRANQTGKSFIAAPPDADNPNYWQEKNTDVRTPANNTNNHTNDTAQQAYFKKLVNHWNSRKAKFVSVVFTPAKTTQGQASGTHAKIHPVTALAGTQWYATMAGGADSYVPGPVRVQLQEGPFAGGYALGDFEIAPDGTHLILSFDTLSYQDRTYSITAVAVDPRSQIPGLTGDVDHHWIRRYALPFAAAFLSGADALLQANSAVITNATTTTVVGPHLSNAQLGLVMAGTAADKLLPALIPQGVLALPEVKLKPGQGLGFLLLKSI